MAKYNTASDCGCAQDMPQSKMPDNSCQDNSAPCRTAPCNPGTGQSTESPCPANMRQRQMANTQRQMAQIRRSGTPSSCQAGMGQRQMSPAPHSAMYPHHMGKRPSHPSMMQPCPGKDDPLAGMPIAMAYVPWQFFQNTYEPDKALQYGTIFPELNKPFYGKGGCPK